MEFNQIFLLAWCSIIFILFLVGYRHEGPGFVRKNITHVSFCLLLLVLVGSADIEYFGGNDTAQGLYPEGSVKNAWMLYGWALDFIFYLLLIVKVLPKYSTRILHAKYNKTAAKLIVGFVACEGALDVVYFSYIQNTSASFDQLLYLVFLNATVLVCFTVVASILCAAVERYYSNMRELELDLVNAKLRLDTLRNQINPHFMFNVINEAYSVALDREQDMIAEYMLELADVLRYLVYDINHSHVELSKEIGMLRSYVSLQKKRFADIEVNFIYSKEVKELKIVPMILMTYVENAFKYVSGDRLFVDISIQTLNDNLVFEISNSISKPVEFVEGTRQTRSSGVGLKNTEKRLAMEYSNRHSVEIESSDSIFKVKLRIECDELETCSD